MNTLLANALIWHVFLGIAGIVSFAALLVLLSKQDFPLKWLKFYSLFGAFAFLGSWISGGYYYTAYYGKAVKPVIKSSQYPWIHSFLMETKEHVFLFLPFLAVVIFILVILLGGEFPKNEKLKKTAILLVFLIVTIGIFITLSGIAISGAVVRKI